MAPDIVTVRMAEMNVITDGRSLKTVLGSCVGVVVRDPERHVIGLAHIMLPLRKHEGDLAGKYADSAIPALIELLNANGCRSDSLEAMLIGGAQMFPQSDSGIASIGEQNLESARRVLREMRLPVVFEDTGGTAGRTMLVSNVTGTVTVTTLRAITEKEDKP